ncbi:MAG: penicillin-binding protein 1C [Desulfovibrio sp.]|nr:penicillin-binding protein 1C [Desulfovibrio sp.]
MKRLAKGVLAGLFMGVCALFASIHFSERPPLLENIPFGKIALDSGGGVLKIGLASDDKYRLRTGIDKIPDYAINALLKYEDQYFYAHPGVNIFSLLRGALGMLGGGRRLGGSTITMQVARMRGGLKTNTIAGKARQIWDALRIERHYGKDEIIEAYFNLAPYGGNIEGLEAAARLYFNKPAERLTRHEIQALTVTPQNPAKRHPIRGESFAEARDMLRRILEDGDGVAPPLEITAPGSSRVLAPHLVAELFEREKRDLIETYIEKDLQKALEGALRSFAERGRFYGVENAAAMIVDAREVSVVACAGSADFNNVAIAGQVDGTRARRSPGSTLKPFIYGLALDQGLIHPASVLPDSPRSFGGYDPENFDYGFRGPVTAAEALKSSRNLPAILLTEQLRSPDLYDFLKSAEIKFPHDRNYYGLALALGGAEISMRELTSLYAALLNGGLWRPVRLARGEKDVAPRRLLSPEAAWLTLWMLERPEAVVKNAGRYLACGYKTGTSNGYRDAWTIGTFGQYVIAVWVGNFNNEPNPLFVGAKTALPLFQDVVAGLSSLRKATDRQKSLFVALNLEKAPVYAATGDFSRDGIAQTGETIFIPGVSPTRDTGVLRRILVDKTTGLRACHPDPGRTEEKIWEIWPSDLKRIFERAGVNKPDPPAWAPECAGRTTVSPPPRILSPKKNVVYQKLARDADFKIPLIAAADSEAGLISWYAGTTYIGKTAPGETIFWRPERAGVAEIAAVDSAGRTARAKCEISLLASPETVKAGLP